MGKGVKNTDGAQPKVSVIIPVYNTEKYLDEAVGSISAQTLKDIEILVVNDGSTDGSLEVLGRMAEKDPRIKIFSQSNAGQSVARNRALDIAKGKYIYFMDSDDRLDADAFEVCYEKCESEDLDFVIFDADSFCEVEGFAHMFDYIRAGKIEDRVYTGMEMLQALIHINGYSVSPCLSLIRRAYFEDQKIRFYPGIIHEDELYSAQLYIPAQRIGRIDRAFFHRRYRADSVMTRVYSERTITGYMTVMAQLSAYARTRPADQAAMVRMLMARMLNAVMLNAYSMPRKNRMALLGEALTKYTSMVKPKSALILLMPGLKRAKRTLSKQ